MEYTSKEVYEYVSKKTNDSIVERKKCRVSLQEFPIYQSDLDFYDKISPTFEIDEGFAKEFLEKNNDVKNSFEYKDGKLKAKLPTPTLCPEERYRRKIAFRNEINLYKRTCDFTGKNIVSIYSPDKNFTVYDQKIWRSDMRDPLDFGLDIDYNKSVLQSFKELLCSVPMLSLQNTGSENSEYCTLGGYNKNCYLMVGNASENCCYGRYGTKNQDCYDFLFSIDSTNCFEIINAHNCYKVFFSQNVYNCNYSYFLTDCKNCSYCIACTNLTNKKYHIYNRPVSKEEFESFIEKNLSNRNSILKINGKASQFNKNLPKKNEDNLETDQMSFGNNLSHAKNVRWGFDSTGTTDSIKDCKYIYLSTVINDCYDMVDTGENSALCYDSLTCCGRSILFSANVFDSIDILYSNMCYNCSHCFCCVGLRNKSYCIFNRQYSKDEYNRIVAKLIAKMIREGIRGSFLSANCSPFGYNETIAMLYCPLTKQEALDKGYKWSDYEIPLPHVEKKVQGKDLPKLGCGIIKKKKPDFLNKILNYAIICEVSKKPFRITKQEIDFYVKHNLPLPTKHPNIRHTERLTKTNSAIMHLTHCNNCGIEMLSVCKPGEGKKILCEKCYNKEIN